jgi:hypothetical protein
MLKHLVSVTLRKNGCVKKKDDFTKDNISQMIYRRHLKGNIHAVALEM